MGVDENRMKFLLFQYRRKKKRKLADAKKSGSGANDIKVHKWFVYQRFTFLVGINKQAKKKKSKVISFTVIDSGHFEPSNSRQQFEI
jgi:hypothetical protein